MTKPCSGAKIVELIVCPFEESECGHAPARPAERCAGCDGVNIPDAVRKSVENRKAMIAQRRLVERGMSPEDARAGVEKTRSAPCSGCGKKK